MSSYEGQAAKAKAAADAAAATEAEVEAKASALRRLQRKVREVEHSSSADETGTRRDAPGQSAGQASEAKRVPY